ncbi:MAG: copper resistance protein CopC [Pseudohongiellaceae bacterium]
MKLGKIHFLTLFGIGALLGSSAVAQPFAPSVHRQPADVTGIVAKTETDPPDDAVLFAAPSLLNLHFPSAVRLVKLTLHNEQRDWVDISFRYSPRPQDDYEWDLPQLDPAVYYTADWAILVANDRLVRGSFSFSFGQDAQRPSVIKAEEEALLLQRYGDPTIQYVPTPRTDIIINQDPPQYDPPFTIDLDETSTDNNDN